jgi:uncharacterized RDD family membrane protein YckC
MSTPGPGPGGRRTRNDPGDDPFAPPPPRPPAPPPAPPAPPGKPGGPPAARLVAAPRERLGAWFIDTVVLLPLWLVVAVPFLVRLTALEAHVRTLPQAVQAQANADAVAGLLTERRLLVLFAVVRLLMGVYQFALVAWRGGTVGMLALGLRVEGVGGGRLPTGRSALRAALAIWLTSSRQFFLPLGALDVALCLASRRRQCLHDLLSGSLVVRR